MDTHGLAVVLDHIISCLESKERRVDSETYEQLFRGIAEVLASFADRINELSELRDATYAMRNYDCAYLLEGFDIGACWGAMKVAEAFERQERDVEIRRQCLDKLRSKEQWRILEAIGNQPGITQGDLARELGKSASNLSQMLSRILPYRLVTISIDGRRRHYSLTAFGREMLDEVRVSAKPEKELNGATHAEMGSLKAYGIGMLMSNENWSSRKIESPSGHRRSFAKVGGRPLGLAAHNQDRQMRSNKSLIAAN